MVKKSLFAVIMALIAVVALPSCGNNSAKSEKSEDSKDKKEITSTPGDSEAMEQLQQVAELMNESCPEDMGDGVSLLEVSYDESDNLFAFTFKVDDASAIQTFNENKTEAKKIFMTSFCQSAAEFNDLIISANTNVNFIIVGPAGDRIILKATPADFEKFK